jgi:hypothetical protein
MQQQDVKMFKTANEEEGDLFRAEILVFTVVFIILSF